MKAIAVVVLMVLLAVPVVAENIFDEIGDMLTPLVPDQVSASFLLDTNIDGHIKLQGNYEMFPAWGKYIYFDLWRLEPLGIGTSYNLFGGKRDFGIGYDKALRAEGEPWYTGGVIYWRQGYDFEF